MALAVWTEPALARSYLNCLTKKVVIVDAPRGSTSSSIEENLSFWIDEAAKTLVLANGTALTVRRFDDRWISAARSDMSYELDRQNGNLMYASSTTKEGSATIIIGSGQCKIAAGPAGLSVPKIRFCNNGDEVRRGPAPMRCGLRAGWCDGSERLCQETDESSTRYDKRHTSSGSGVMRGIFPVCCALRADGHAAASPPSNVMELPRISLQVYGWLSPSSLTLDRV